MHLVTSEVHLEAVHQIVRYLKSLHVRRIVYSKVYGHTDFMLINVGWVVLKQAKKLLQVNTLSSLVIFGQGTIEEQKLLFPFKIK